MKTGNPYKRFISETTKQEKIVKNAVDPKPKTTVVAPEKAPKAPKASATKAKEKVDNKFDNKVEAVEAVEAVEIVDNKEK
jgi:hypothetical protein